MKHMLLVLLAFMLVGCCTTNECRATYAANSMYDLGLASSGALEVGCTERYAAARSGDEVKQLDKACLPLSSAYAALRIAHAQLVAVIVSGDLSKLPETLSKAAEAATRLAKALGDMP